jgi:hypothetical protein
VVDRKPPRGTADERTTVLALLQYQRDSFVRKVTGVTEDDARRAPVGSGTSLLWLAQHLGEAEQLWFVRRFAGEATNLAPAPTLAGAIARYRDTSARADAIVATAPSLDVLTKDTGDESPVNLRWVLMHLLEETARHAGHADILRELLDGETGR